MTATRLTRLTLTIATLSAATVLLCQPRAQADEQLAAAVITMPAVTVTGQRMQVVVMPQVVVTGRRDVSDLQLAQQARAVRGTRG
ncbi:hypothetical protein [Rhizobacter sp. SG703]|uniref:hypothetical protein n=1 Tax=Rhizobacter sp. SG703 TaxID=2587140 RepID=UPI0014460DA7|nr:hypothetical protein [Rhizobacter sp. SG703]NKI93591.1 hypothetical protein [Rhizobacter sp. SG703]